MKLILDKKKISLSTSGYKHIHINEDKEDNDVPISTTQLILFFIFIIIILILILIIILTVLYKFVIKPDLEKSRKKKHPEIFLSYNEKRKVEKYINDCINGVLYDKTKYKKTENPKISVIIPVYNKEMFILRILRSIQNQSFKDIEIIFCDDGSYDNSTKLVKEYQKEDDRIILMRHDINRGTLMTRNDGANLAKGEYLLFIDGDDISVNNILEKTYLKAKETGVDIIQYQMYSGDFNNSFYCNIIKRKSEIIYQPELSSLMYYEDGYLHQTEYHVCGKLIKRNIFLETIRSIDNYYLNQSMSLHEDGLILFILFKTANSYLFLDEYGLLYYYNEYSTLRNIRKAEKINKATKDSFLYLEFMFNYTNNTLYEKNMAFFQFESLIYLYNDIFQKTTKGFDYIYKVIDLYINCNIFSKENKTFIKNIKKQFINVQKNLTQ